ncbi:leucine zipper domain-containing protein [Methylobacterium sp.]|nr:hypothetical protein [Methylobacterium sp.]
MNTHQHARMAVHGRALPVNRILVDGWCESASKPNPS